MRLARLIGDVDRWSRLLGWAVALGLLCGIVGPFGSYPANPFFRITYWIGLFVVGTLMLWPPLALAALLADRHKLSPTLPAGLALAAGCVPLAAAAAAGGQLLWPIHAGAMRALEWYGQTLCIALPAAAAMLWLELFRHGSTSHADHAAAAARRADEDEPVLPQALLEAALCLQMEDHHVRVHAAGFSRLCLATLREAVAQVGAERGLQVHRSWWVARNAVAGWSEEGRTVRLRLVNGLQVPVARSRVALLRAEGWLPAAAPARGSATVSA